MIVYFTKEKLHGTKIEKNVIKSANLTPQTQVPQNCVISRIFLITKILSIIILLFATWVIAWVITWVMPKNAMLSIEIMKPWIKFVPLITDSF